MSSARRDIADVDRVILHAKLQPEDLLPQSQVLCFSSRLLDLSKVRLLEVDQDLADQLQEGQTLVMKGVDTDGVVLCTQDKTYDVKEAETSNSLLVLEDLAFPEQLIAQDKQGRSLVGRNVLGVSYRYLELKECKPRLKRLFEVLSEVALGGKQDLEEGRGKTVEELEDTVQCSKKELLVGLIDLDACQLDGRWYLLDCDYCMKILSLIANFIEENSWSLDQVDRAETVSALQDIEPPELVGQVFDQHHEHNSNDDERLYRAKTQKLSRFYGEYLLQTGSVFELGEFRTMWQQAVPEGVETQLEHLKGIALLDTASSPQTIRYFPERSLPESVQERLEMLFDLKEKWTAEEIEPFVETLTTSKLNVNGLLTKFARGSKTNGVKYFSSKHGK